MFNRLLHSNFYRKPLFFFLTAMLCFCATAVCSYDEFVSLNPDNEKDYPSLIPPIIEENPFHKDVINVYILPSKHNRSWVILCTTTLNPAEQNFRHFIWSRQRRPGQSYYSIEELSENRFPSKSQCIINSKILLASPLPSFRDFEEIIKIDYNQPKERILIQINRREAHRTYIFFDDDVYNDEIRGDKFGKSYHHTIDLGAYLKKMYPPDKHISPQGK